MPCSESPYSYSRSPAAETGSRAASPAPDGSCHNVAPCTRGSICLDGKRGHSASYCQTRLMGFLDRLLNRRHRQRLRRAFPLQPSVPGTSVGARPWRLESAGLLEHVGGLFPRRSGAFAFRPRWVSAWVFVPSAFPSACSVPHRSRSRETTAAINSVVAHTSTANPTAAAVTRPRSSGQPSSLHGVV